MRVAISALTIVALAGCLIGKSQMRSLAANTSGSSRERQLQSTSVAASQPNSLCAKDEHILFSCPVKRTDKIISLCASRDLDKERGYLQYRFGLPGKVELEFPKDRQGTQQQFRYLHYFRYQVDLTEITFQIDIYEYSIFDTYNGEAKPAVAEQGVNVTQPGRTKDVTFVCRSKPQTDYSALQDVLPHDQE